MEKNKTFHLVNREITRGDEEEVVECVYREKTKSESIDTSTVQIIFGYDAVWIKCRHQNMERDCVGTVDLA